MNIHRLLKKVIIHIRNNGVTCGCRRISGFYQDGQQLYEAGQANQLPKRKMLQMQPDINEPVHQQVLQLKDSIMNSAENRIPVRPWSEW